MFKDYSFGLKLAQRSEGAEFLITAEAIDDPDKYLSDWLVKTYRSQPPADAVEGQQPA